MAVSSSGVIRIAAREDIERLSKLAVETYIDAFGHTFGASDLALHLERNLSPSCFGRIIEEDVVLVLEVEGRMIGYVQFGESRMVSEGSPIGSQEVRRLYV